MGFVVIGAEWVFDGLSVAETEKALDVFLAFLDTSQARGETIEIGDDFQCRPMRDGQTLWELFAEDSDKSLSGEIRQEMAAWLGSASFYADAAVWPDGAENTIISLDGQEPIENQDVAWVHHSVRAGNSVACFSLKGNNVYETTTDSGMASIHFVQHEAGRRAFWRERVVIDGNNSVSLIKFVRNAYPDIHFVDGVLDHLNRLSGGYLAFSDRIRAAFACLDDWGGWVFNCHPPAMRPGEESALDAKAAPTNQLIEKRFLSLGLRVAPENSNVYQNGICRKAREAVLGGRTLYFEWHIKLEPHRNRIHIHKPVPESDHKVIVGMIADHLPLP